jgi:hypothetical protein
MPCYSPLLGWSARGGGFTFRRDQSYGTKMTVACGGCLGCRLDKSKEWAARIVHEASMYQDNCFITLTYDPEHLPRDGSLNKEHFQKFMKRLRRRFPDRRIRYYHCGEYGNNYDRPHYHACLFNLDFPDKELFSNREGNYLFTSKILEDVWRYGFCTVGELTYESAAYCARYVLKKVTGERAHDHYSRVDLITGEVYELQPEYTTMSRGSTCKEHRGMPYQKECRNCSRGIGREWYEKYKEDLFPSDEVPVPGRGVFKKVPRYYEEQLGAESECELEAVKQRRRVFRDAHADEYSPERLMAKYKVKKAQAKMLKRGIEE